MKREKAEESPEEVRNFMPIMRVSNLKYKVILLRG